MKQKHQFPAVRAGTESIASSQGMSGPLPSDLLHSAAQRLGWAALLYAGAFAVAYAIVHLTFHFPSSSAHGGAIVVCGIAVGVSICLYLAVRSNRFDPNWLLDLGLVYWVFGALCIDISYYTGVLELGLSTAGISWVCVWLVIYPLVVPNRPRKVLVAALAAASMGPLAFLIGFGVTGGKLPVSFHPLQAFSSYFVCVGLAYISARIVHRMGKAVREAREMGSYRLIRQLGSGGMGEVWLAKHRLLARPAAVKFVPLDRVLSGPTSTQNAKALLNRFEREAQATAALHCQHTIELYDFGVTEDGTFYYAMEFLEGLDADTLVKRYGPVPLNRVVFWLLQLCESLEDAHSTGLVHRDIKPGNLFICRFGRLHDFVKVLDFGLVKAQADFGQANDNLTQTGTITGTPAYLAPEVALGQVEVDARADIYSMGCTAYWLLTRRPVFEGATGMEVILQHVNDLPVRPSERNPEVAITPEMEEIIMVCLEKEPDKRPQSATAIAEQLRGLQLADPWTYEKAAAWWREHQPVEVTEGSTVASLVEETIESQESHVTGFQLLTNREP